MLNYFVVNLEFRNGEFVVKVLEMDIQIENIASLKSC